MLAMSVMGLAAVAVRCDVEVLILFGGWELVLLCTERR